MQWYRFFSICSLTAMLTNTNDKHHIMHDEYIRSHTEDVTDSNLFMYPNEK